VEKPMTLSSSDGRVLADLVAEKKALLTVGFNRRFSPHAVRMKELLRPIASPKSFLYRINAGALPPDHWLLDPGEGGGRILGEGVHFFDFLCFLAGSPPSRVVGASPRRSSRDECAASLEFPDGSIGAVLYSAGGAPSAGKERVEALAGAQTFVLDDFQRLEAYGPHPSVFRTKTVEKGQRGQLDNFARALGGSEDLGVTAEDGFLATWIAEQALAQR
jgi:predicted dehydrogenase